MPTLSGWKYRKDLTIYKPVGYSVPNYIHTVDVSYKNGKMNADFSDIRFTLQDKYTKLSHWRADDYVEEDSATFYVLVGNLTEDITIYMYYGNPEASSESDLDSTFASPNFGDDFNDESVDGDKWDYSGDITEIHDIWATTGQLLMHHPGGSAQHYIESDDQFSVNKELIMRIFLGSEADSRRSDFGLMNGDIDFINICGTQDVIFNFEVYTNSNYGLNEIHDDYTIGIWYLIKIRWWSDRVEFYVDGNLIASTESEYIPSSNLKIRFDGDDWIYNRTWWDRVDFAVIRNIWEDSDDPITDLWGDEEEFTLDKVRIQVGVVPYEDISDIAGGTRKALSGEVRKFFMSDFHVEDVNLALDGQYNGYNAGAPYFIEAAVNGGNVLSSLVGSKFIFLINTGRQYYSSSELGDKIDYSLKISTDGALITMLKEREPWFCKDNNGDIDPSGIVLETVEHDGSTVSSGTGLGIKFLILQ